MKTFMTVAFGTLLLASMAAYAAGEPYVGLELRPLGADVASYLGIHSGVLVGGVIEKSPADMAGLKINDIICYWNGEAVTSPEALVAKVKASTPGQEVQVKILRKGVEHELTCKIGTREGEMVASPEESISAGYLGIAFDSVPPLLREYLGFGENIRGVYVVEVLNDSPAAKAGLKDRDIILKVNGKDVLGPAEFQAIINGTHPKDMLKLECLRAGRDVKVDVELALRPANFEKSMHHMMPGMPNRPGAEKFKDRFTLKFRDGNGREHVIPFPTWGAGRELALEMPNIKWPEGLSSAQIKELEARVREAMQTAMKEIEQHSKQLKEAHGAFIEKLRGAPQNSRSVVVSEATSQVTSSDGTHEITISTHDGVKTVTVKEGSNVLAQNLPFDKIGTLPDAVQKKIKDLDASVIIKTEGSMAPAPNPMPAEKNAEKDTHKAPADVNVPTETL